jgi:hypothetical protein
LAYEKRKLNRVQLAATGDLNGGVTSKSAREAIAYDFAAKCLHGTLGIRVAKGDGCAVQPPFNTLESFALRREVGMKLLAFLYD